MWWLIGQCNRSERLDSLATRPHIIKIYTCILPVLLKRLLRCWIRRNLSVSIYLLYLRN
jgi:hypothetical protein